MANVMLHCPVLSVIDKLPRQRDASAVRRLRGDYRDHALPQAVAMVALVPGGHADAEHQIADENEHVRRESEGDYEHEGEEGRDGIVVI